MANPRGNPNWKKGVSANPKGRPKGHRDRAVMIEEAMAAQITGKWSDTPQERLEGVAKFLAALEPKDMKDLYGRVLPRETKGTLAIEGSWEAIVGKALQKAAKDAEDGSG